MITSRSRFALALLPAVVTLVLVTIALASGRALTRAAGWVDHTRQVMEHSNALLLRTVDAETGQRGYLVTLDTLFLNPYSGAESTVRQALDSLRRLTVDNPRQQLRLDTLASELTERFAILDSGITMQKSGQIGTIMKGRTLRNGRHSMDRVRRLVADIQASEQHLLDRRRTDERRSDEVVRLVLLFGGLIAVVVAIVVNVFLARIITECERMTRELGAQLDDLVAARREIEERNRRDS